MSTTTASAGPEMAGIQKCPGINCSLRYHNNRGTAGTDFYRLGSFCYRVSETPLLQAREVAMLILMDRLTDKPDWHEKIFNRTIVEEWKEEALSQPEQPLWDKIIACKNIVKPKFQRILTERAFDYCIDELKAKAAHFKQTGLVLTMNSNQNMMVKSDTAVSGELRRELQAAFEKLSRDQAADPDYNPDTAYIVQDMVHPSMYPFVYGKSIFIQDEVVGVQDAIEKWAGKGEVSKDSPYAEPEQDPDATRGQDNLQHVQDRYWSKKYQWLPANLAFNDDGTVRFTSYINNLHPKRYPEIYRAIEKLIDVVIPAWELVLSGRAVTASSTVETAGTSGTEDKIGAGQAQQRFRHIPPPRDEYDMEPEELWEDFDPDRVAAHEQEHGDIEYDHSQADLPHLDDDTFDGLNEEEKKPRRIIKLKWMKIRDAKLPEPLDFEPVTYSVQHRLKDKFKDSGLQVIVKMTSVKFKQHDFPIHRDGPWRTVDGLMNERIVATALFYLDSENIAPGCMHFCMSADDGTDYLTRADARRPYSPYEQVFATKVNFVFEQLYQQFDILETRQGRMLAYPNVFRHSGTLYKLEDRAKPGHQSVITLYLVDPHQRIVSTGNVPPQQLDWWAEAVFGCTGSEVSKGELPAEVFQLLLEQGLSKSIKHPAELLDSLESRLPTEIMDMLRQNRALPVGILTPEEAREHCDALRLEHCAAESVEDSSL